MPKLYFRAEIGRDIDGWFIDLFRTDLTWEKLDSGVKFRPKMPKDQVFLPNCNSWLDIEYKTSPAKNTTKEYADGTIISVGQPAANYLSINLCSPETSGQPRSCCAGDSMNITIHQRIHYERSGT